jgi:hypothetical protein
MGKEILSSMLPCWSIAILPKRYASEIQRLWHVVPVSSPLLTHLPIGEGGNATVSGLRPQSKHYVIELSSYPAIAELDGTASTRQIGQGSFIDGSVDQLEGLLTARLAKLRDEESIQDGATRTVKVSFPRQGYPRQWRCCLPEVLDDSIDTKLAVELVKSCRISSKALLAFD